MINTREEIEVGKIEPKIFQLYCVLALQDAFSCHKNDEGRFEELSIDTYIDIVNPTQIRATLIKLSKNVNEYYIYGISYQDDYIIIQCEADYEINVRIDYERLDEFEKIV